MRVRRLWIDSNAGRRPKDLSQLSNAAKRSGGAVQLAAHAQVHLEMCRYMRARWGDAFDATTVATTLEELGLHIEPLFVGATTADRWADRLFQLYPTDDDWQQAKRQAAGSQGTRRVSMTVDWWMALAIDDLRVAGHDDRVVTFDKGSDWADLRRKGIVLDLRGALAWIAQASSAG